jgi:hypothetical protein
MMGLDTRALRDLWLIYTELNQCDLCKQGQYHCGCWGRCQAFVPWERLAMREEEQTDLSLDDTVDQQAQHGQHG